jgi:hypothetical protein
VQNDEVRIVADRLAFVVKCVCKCCLFRRGREEGKGSEKMLSAAGRYLLFQQKTRISVLHVLGSILISGHSMQLP